MPSGLRLDLATLQMKSHELDSSVTSNKQTHTSKPRYGSFNPEESFGATKNTLRMGDIRELLEKDTK